MVSSHLSSTQTNVELVEIFGPFGGKARSIHQSSHGPKGTEVEGESDVALCVGKVAVTVTQTVVLSKRQREAGVRF